MKKNTPQSIDGFTVRRRQNNPEDTRLGIDSLPVPEQFLHNAPTLRRPHDDRSIGDAVNHEQATTSEAPKVEPTPVAPRKDMPRRTGAPKGPRKSRFPSWLTNKKFLIGMAIAVALVFGALGIKMLMSSLNPFEGNLFDIFSSRQLKQDQYGRTNILVFGTSEDSQAHQAEGAGVDLTDSIQVISLDQEKKDVVMFSVPRDLWVNYGEACLSGYEGKINVVYECAKDGATEKAGAERLMEVVGDTFGLDMQYWVKVNYTAVKDAVDAVGGITVTIDSDDPRGIYDPNFDWQCGFECNLVKHPNGPAELNGEEALALARARNAAGGYGLAGGNFDREQNQQKIMLALKDKAISAGTLANPIKVSGLVDSFGDNVRSNFATGEIRTLASLANEIEPNSIKTLSLVDVEDPVMTVGEYYGQSIVQPVAGIGNFTDVQNYIRTAMTNTPTSDEDADIAVLNATDMGGIAAAWQRELSTDGIIVSEIGDAPTGVVGTDIRWYDMTGGTKPRTAAKIAEVLGVESSGQTLPAGVQSSADFVIVVGDGTT